MESSRRDVSIDMVVDRCILENNEITLLPCFTTIPTHNRKGAFDSAKNHKRQRRKR